MADKEIEVFHRTKSSDGGVEDLGFSDPPAWSSAVESGDVRKRSRVGERASYTVSTQVDGSSTSSGVFWLVMLQLIGQTLLATLILIFFLVYVDRRAFNVTERRPHYQLANGTQARLPERDWYPLQSDITTIISGAFNLLGKLYSSWIALLTWNYAFLLLERNGMQLQSLSSMVALPFLPALFPPAGFKSEPARALDAADEFPRNRGSARKWLAIGIALTMLSAFPASFSPPIATGSISWHASTRNVSNADIIYNIGSQGANYGDFNPWASWCDDPGFRPRYIERASALATHAWNSVTDIPDSTPTFKRVIPSVQNLPVGSSLNNVTIPMFVIESFDWITDASDVSSAQLAYITVESTPGTLYSDTATDDPDNPLQSTPGVVALLPDEPFTSLGLKGTIADFQPLMVQSKTGVVAVAVNYDADCDPTEVGPFGPPPPNVFFSGAKQDGYTMCFIFAKITYSAGAVNCEGCEVVFPLVVQNPAGVDLTLQADVATQQALYAMADVIGELARANVTLPALWGNTEMYTKELLVRGYSSAWTVMSEMMAYYGFSLPSTEVAIPITTSQAIVDRRRVWAWYALQVLTFIGGFIFVVHMGTAEKYPISNPMIHGLMMNVEIPEESKEKARGDIETWTEDFKDTFIIWERESKTSKLAIKGELERAKDPLWRRVLSHCFSCIETTAETAESG